MDDSDRITTSSPPDAVNSTASANPAPQESLPYQINQNHEEVYPNTPEQSEETRPGETMSLSALKGALQRQLEYYFSRENLSTDEYLVSQMDSENYVAISTVAKFNQVRRLTDDHNLVVEVLRESALVQVDDSGEKVRPSPRSGVLILREIPEATPIKELEDLFSSEDCPKFLRCEYANNNTWYVLFESDDDTQRAYQYLRESNVTFHGKPVRARMKAKAITSAPFTSYKNGNPPQETENFPSQPVNPPPQQTPIQYTYTNVPNENYSNQQVCPPFYPPTMLQAWAPTTPACVDLGTVLSVNGLSPQAAYRPLNSNTNRHNFNSRDSEQNRYFNRSQSASYLQRQQLHQQTSFPNLVNTGTCTFDYVPYTTTRSRNVHNFGVDMNFFTAPNLYYNKVPASIYPTRHNPVLMQRTQDQAYVAGNSNSYSKEASTGKQASDSQVKENWAPNQSRPQRSKRWWKENGSSGSSRNFCETSSNTYNKSNETETELPQFDLETSSFPPLPGCMETDIIDVDVYESRLSDIVKGTVKPTTRDTKTQTSESGVVCSTKDSSTITIEDTVASSDGAFPSTDVVTETGTTTESVVNVENCHEDSNEWEEYVDSPTDKSTLCNTTSINLINVVPNAPLSASSRSGTPAFHTPTNSIANGTESSASLPEAESNTNVPSDAAENKSAAKVQKPKQVDNAKGLPSPKNKSSDASKRFDARTSLVATKHRATGKNTESSSSSSNKERVNDSNSKSTTDQNSDSFYVKEKVTPKNSNANKSKPLDVESALLSVNGHADSESTVSSEDEKPSRKPTYSEVAMRAKEKVEKIAQEIKEKERQEAMVRQHRQQEVNTQSGLFREIPRGRLVETRPGSKEWRERRKPARAISLPAAGQ